MTLDFNKPSIQLDSTLSKTLDTQPFLKQKAINMSTNHLQTYLVNVLGCKVNQYDAQQIEQLLERYGLNKTETPDDADVIVVHTCGVTAAAAQKSRQTIRKMQRNNPLARVIVLYLEHLLDTWPRVP